MAPHQSSRLAARDASDSSEGMNGIIIAGIIVAAVIGLGAFTWLGIRWYRKRAADKRAARRGSAFANFSPEGEKGSASRCVARTLSLPRMFIDLPAASLALALPSRAAPSRATSCTLAS